MDNGNFLLLHQWIAETILRSMDSRNLSHISSFIPTEIWFRQVYEVILIKAKFRSGQMKKSVYVATYSSYGPTKYIVIFMCVYKYIYNNVHW